MKRLLKTAFTLAEVLITLGIIGIVAALTIPTLINKYQEQEAVSKVKETYSMVSQAVNQWAGDIGCVGQIQKCMAAMDWQWGEVYPEEPRMDWTHYLKVIDKRTRRWDGTIPGWLNYERYFIDGTQVTDGNAGSGCYMGVGKKYEAHRTFQYLLANGVILAVSDGVGSFMWMDINGSKGPNRIAKDQFPIGFGRWDSTGYGVIPYYTECTWIGSSEGVCSYNCPSPCNPDDGKSPTAYVLKHSKLPDLTTMGYPSAP
jgi:prepilin-type N-terminal cleavage/methylation domain-containing protein